MIRILEDLQLKKESKELMLSDIKELNISKEIFDMKPYSEMADKLLDDIDSLLMSIRDQFAEQFGTGFDIDDNGLDGNPEVTADRSIIYKAQLFKFDNKNFEQISLKKKESSIIENALINKIILPKEDESYEYELSVNLYNTQLSITLRRISKI